MMRGKSPPSALISRENQVEQLFGFLREFGKGDNFILVKISFCRIASRKV